jgi:hypothetical protein
MEYIFTDIYETYAWGNNNNTEYSGSSGRGSDVEYNKESYIPFLKKFIIQNNIQSIVDLGCGDFRCGRLLYDDLDVIYTGYDVYKRVIEYNSRQYSLPKYSFVYSDFCIHKENIIGGDLCILKDVLQHWSSDTIYSFLDYLVNTKKFKYILIVNCCKQRRDNTDISNGDWRPLSHKFLPLKKYTLENLYNYASKEVSVIKL